MFGICIKPMSRKHPRHNLRGCCSASCIWFKRDLSFSSSSGSGEYCSLVAQNVYDSNSIHHFPLATLCQTGSSSNTKSTQLESDSSYSLSLRLESYKFLVEQNKHDADLICSYNSSLDLVEYGSLLTQNLGDWESVCSNLHFYAQTNMYFLQIKTDMTQTRFFINSLDAWMNIPLL